MVAIRWVMLLCLISGSLAFAPDYVVLQEYAAALCAKRCYKEAAEFYQIMFDQDHTLVGALYNRGNALKCLSRLDEAIEAYRKVIDVTPFSSLTHRQACFARGLTYLMRNRSDVDWIKGWQDYDWRWDAMGWSKEQFGDKPFWQGQPLLGKTILVIDEQGLGDTIQFIRYCSLLKSSGARVVLICRAPLKRLLQTGCDYLDEVLSDGDVIPPFDYQIHLLSLPKLFRTTERSVPVTIPYLKADAQLVDFWRAKLGADKQFKIGLCWQGGPNHFCEMEPDKSMALHQLLGALSKVPGCSFYSLQKQDSAVSGSEHACIIDFGEAFDRDHGRFMDTAALMMNLDLVIIVDTSVAHLAAALGVPTWIILPNPADWRWMVNRSDTPWYPQVRLFRQEKTGDWTAVLENVVNALHAIVCRTMKSDEV